MAILLCSAQNKNNYIDVSTNGSIDFNLNSAVALETQQVNLSALKIQFQTQNSNRLIYVRSSNGIPVSGTNVPAIPANYLGIQYRSGNFAGNIYYYSTPVFFTNTDQAFIYAQKVNMDFFGYYDLILKPIGYDFAPGTYTFTVTFTMTQP